MLIRVLFVLIASLIGFLFGFRTENVIRYTVLMAVISGGAVFFEYYVKRFSKESVTKMFKGFVAGLLLGAGINAILRSFGITLTPFIRILVYIIMIYIGISLISQLELWFGFIPRATPKGIPLESPKILDTSVIIDGRIADIIDTKFIEGVLVVPKFVLDELQQIADSADSVKRSRGRRGLDVLNRLKRHRETLLRITDQDFPEIHDVDSKLVKLAKTIDGKIITNDFNLHKVAELQGVPVLNINHLANALKPIVLPGEKLKIVVIKEGKDPGQGIGYLDDGTMVVVDSGKRFVGEEITVNVTSVLQTPAGRMIFAKSEND